MGPLAPRPRLFAWLQSPFAVLLHALAPILQCFPNPWWRLINTRWNIQGSLAQNTPVLQAMILFLNEQQSFWLYMNYTWHMGYWPTVRDIGQVLFRVWKRIYYMANKIMNQKEIWNGKYWLQMQNFIVNNNNNYYYIILRVLHLIKIATINNSKGFLNHE